MIVMPLSECELALTKKQGRGCVHPVHFAQLLQQRRLGLAHVKEDGDVEDGDAAEREVEEE